jgi:hypothetical protein
MVDEKKDPGLAPRRWDTTMGFSVHDPEALLRYARGLWMRWRLPLSESPTTVPEALGYLLERIREDATFPDCGVHVLRSPGPVRRKPEQEREEAAAEDMEWAAAVKRGCQPLPAPERDFAVRIGADYIHDAEVIVRARSVEEAAEKAKEMIGNTSLSLRERVPDSEFTEVVGSRLPAPCRRDGPWNPYRVLWGPDGGVTLYREGLVLSLHANLKAAAATAAADAIRNSWEPGGVPGVMLQAIPLSMGSVVFLALEDVIHKRSYEACLAELIKADWERVSKELGGSGAEVLWEGEMPNWRIAEGALEREVPAENRRRRVWLARGGGYGGVTLGVGHEGIEAQVYLELGDDGVALRVYVAGQDEPCHNVRITPQGVFGAVPLSARGK